MVIDPPSGAARVRSTIRAAVAPAYSAAGPLRGQPAEEVGVGRVDQPVAGTIRPPSGLAEIGDDVGRLVFRHSRRPCAPAAG